MSAPFWLRCFYCAEKHSKELRLYLLNCPRSHILCKLCMIKTENGKTCPECKTNIKFSDITKLPSHVKAFFKPDIINELEKPLQWVKFQNYQHQNYFKMSINLAKKSKRIQAERARLEEEIRRLKVQFESTVERRKKMQEKLKEIYIENQRRIHQQQYRNQKPDTPSVSSVGSNSIPSNYKSLQSFPTVSRSAHSNSMKSSTTSFFNKNAPMFCKPKPFVPFAESFINQSSSITSYNSQTIRKPFYA